MVKGGGPVRGAKSGWPAVAGALLAVIALPSCSDGSRAAGPGSVTSTLAVLTPVPLPAPVPGTCGVGTPGPDGGGTRPSVSTGAASRLVDVEVSVAPSAPAGQPLPVITTLVMSGEGPRIILRTKGSAVVVEHDGVVVESSRLASEGDVPLMLRAGARRGAQVLPDHVELRACDGTPLTPGSYRLWVVVAYGADPLNAGAAPGPSGVLVSRVHDLVIT